MSLLDMSFDQRALTSPLTTLDPRTRLICALVLSVAIFCITTPAQLFASALITGIVLTIGRVSLWRAFLQIRPILILMIVLALFNLGFVHTGDVLVDLDWLSITRDGAWAALLYPIRFALAIQMGSLVLITTTPTQLSDALDRLMSPLSRVGLPGHEIAMTMALMLRFVPTLAEEAATIVEAQSMRGGSLDEGGPVRRLRALVPVVVALLASSLRHSQGLARALEARCYEGGERRTHLHRWHLSVRDVWAACITVGMVACLVMLRFCPII